MKVRIIKSNPRFQECDIDDLVGLEFNVIDREEDGVRIDYGDYGGYLIHNDEFEVVSWNNEHYNSHHKESKMSLVKKVSYKLLDFLTTLQKSKNKIK